MLLGGEHPAGVDGRSQHRLVVEGLDRGHVQQRGTDVLGASVYCVKRADGLHARADDGQVGACAEGDSLAQLKMVLGPKITGLTSRVILM